jgi:serine/threonine protein kinase
MSDPNVLIGQRVDHYKIERLIGQGGMAAVYLAQDLTLERQVVLKTMLPALSQNQELMTRFQREAKATAQLQHPNIVPVYTTGVTPSGQPYMAMQYIKGGALNDFLRNLAGQGQWISTIYALSITRQIADALRTAHEANIIHRDLKPGNILLRRDGTPVLTDLGIAAVQQATTRLTQTGSVIGTPSYMSPEQATGQEIDGRSDIYSLGIILYELLSGQLPFDADSPWAIIHKHIYEQPAPLEQVRPDLTAQTIQFVATCLQKDPSQRFQTAAALVAALDAIMVAEGGNPQVVLGSWQPTDNSRIVEGPPTTRPGVKKTPTPGTPLPFPTKPSENGKRLLWHYLLILLTLIVVVGGIFALRGPRLSVVSGVTSSPIPPTNTPSIVTVIATAVPATDVPVVTADETAVPTPIPTPLPTATAVNPYPDGFIAYSCGNGNSNRIYLNTPNGSSANQILLPNQPGNSIVPAFSPSGQQIAYRSNAGGSWQIFVSSVDGSNPRPITAAGQDNYEAVWSPDGSQIAFVSDRGNSKQIYLMGNDGSNQRPLTANNAYNDDPSWSVNGSIIFESDQNGRFSIFQMAATGGTPVELIAWGESSSTPAWSSDGQWLAFESRVGATRQIWIARSNGSNVQQITALGSSDERPAWSPDGTKIAFHSNYLQSDSDFADIWVIDIATKAVNRLTAQGNCYNPSWGLIPANLAEAIKPVSNNPASLPVSETGVAACFGVMDTAVTAGDNTRLWSQPDVSNAQLVQDVTNGTSLRLVSGPVWGRVRLDTEDAGWWYEVESNGTIGWVWQSRLTECKP